MLTLKCNLPKVKIKDRFNMQWNKNKKKILQKPYYVLIINKWEEIINKYKLKFGAMYIYLEMIQLFNWARRFYICN